MPSYLKNRVESAMDGTKWTLTPHGWHHSIFQDSKGVLKVSRYVNMMERWLMELFNMLNVSPQSPLQRFASAYVVFSLVAGIAYIPAQTLSFVAVLRVHWCIVSLTLTLYCTSWLIFFLDAPVSYYCSFDCRCMMSVPLLLECFEQAHPAVV